MLADELSRLSKLHADGVISEEEFKSAKAAVISGAASVAAPVMAIVAQPIVGAGAVSIEVQPIAPGADTADEGADDDEPVTCPSDGEVIETPTGVVFTKAETQGGAFYYSRLLAVEIGCSVLCGVLTIVPLILLLTVPTVSYTVVIFFPLLLCCVLPIILTVCCPIAIPFTIFAAIASREATKSDTIELNTEADEIIWTNGNVDVDELLAAGAECPALQAFSSGIKVRRVPGSEGIGGLSLPTYEPRKETVVKASEVLQFYLNSSSCSSSEMYSVGPKRGARKYRPKRKYTKTTTSYKLYALLKDGSSKVVMHCNGKVRPPRTPPTFTRLPPLPPPATSLLH